VIDSDGLELKEASQIASKNKQRINHVCGNMCSPAPIVQAWDLTAGAASGVAAVIVSMPFDCIKTYMQVCTLMPAGVRLSMAWEFAVLRCSLVWNLCLQSLYECGNGRWVLLVPLLVSSKSRPLA